MSKAYRSDREPNILNTDALPQSTEQKWLDIVKLVKDEYLSTTQDFPWIIGFSGGKDSTLMTHAVFAALEQIPPSLRNREIHVVSNDTMVESPLVLAHLNMSSLHFGHLNFTQSYVSFLQLTHFAIILA